MGVKEASIVYLLTGDSAPVGDGVPSGFKRSEMGVIPEDWLVERLDVIADCLDSLRIPLNESQRGRRRGEIPYCGANGVLDYVDDFVIDDDIILMAEDGGYFDQFETRPIAYRMVGKCWVNNHAHILKARNGFDQGFVFYSLVHKDIQKYLASGTRAKLNRSELNKIEIALPPTKVEQRSVAETLSNTDALIESLQQLIAKKRALKHGAMQELLTGRTRLPGCRGKWAVKSLGEVGEISGAGVDKKSRGGEMPVRLLNYMDVYKGKALKSENFWQKVTAKPDQVLRCSVRRGDVFFTPTSEVRDDIGRSAVALEDVADVVYSYHVVRLRLIEDWDVRFRRYAFKTPEFLSQASTQCEGSGTRYVITLPKFRSMKVNYPLDIDEQSAIATVLSDMDAEIDALETRLAKTRDLKAGMMQALLTGRIRLPIDQAA